MRAIGLSGTFLAVWKRLIGLGLIKNGFMRATLLLLLFQMVSAGVIICAKAGRLRREGIA